MVFWGGAHYSDQPEPLAVMRFPTTSSSACNTALQAARFPPIMGQGTGWNYETGMMTFCLPGGAEIFTAPKPQYPPLPPEPAPAPAP